MCIPVREIYRLIILKKIFDLKIKTKYQSGQNNLINIIKETHKIGFYKGFSLAVMRAIPLHSGVFLGWEIANKYL